MPYAIRYMSRQDAGMLVELPCKALQQKETLQESRRAEEEIYPFYKRIDAQLAHRMVRDDCIHETSLWIDYGGRIRR